jgi:hypothetical protein
MPAFVNPLYSGMVGMRGLIKRAIYRFIPESLSNYPLRRNYTINHFFREFNLPDINNMGWEEYFWQNSPFGFHGKGATSKDNFSQDFKMDQLLDQFR